MATFVLVHGAFTGGWCWHETAHALRQYGHDVLTPTLTGLGERVHGQMVAEATTAVPAVKAEDVQRRMKEEAFPGYMHC